MKCEERSCLFDSPNEAVVVVVVASRME